MQEDSKSDALSNLQTTALTHARTAVDEGQFKKACQHYNTALHPNPKATADQRTVEYRNLDSNLKNEALLGKVAAFCNSILREPKTPPLITHVADAIFSYHSYIRSVEKSPETGNCNRWAMFALLLAMPTQKIPEEISPQEILIADQPKPNAGAKTRLDRATGIMMRKEGALFQEPLSNNAKDSTVQAARAAFLLHLALQESKKNNPPSSRTYVERAAQICQSLTQYPADDPICSHPHLMEVFTEITQLLGNQSSKNRPSSTPQKLKNGLKRLSRGRKKQTQPIAPVNTESVQNCLNLLVKGLIVGSTLFRSWIQGEFQELKKTNEQNLVAGAQAIPADQRDEDEKHQADEASIDDPYTAYLELLVLLPIPSGSAHNDPAQVALNKKHKHRLERILAAYLILLKNLKKTNFTISICFKCAICLNDYLVRYGNDPKQAAMIEALQQELQAIGKQIEIPAGDDFSRKRQTTRLTEALFWDTLGDTYTLTESPLSAKHHALAEEAYSIAGNIWLHSPLAYFLFDLPGLYWSGERLENFLTLSEQQERNQNLCLLDDHFKKCPTAPYTYGIDQYETLYKPHLTDVGERLTGESPALLQQPIHLTRLIRIDKTITVVAQPGDSLKIASSTPATACPPNVVGRGAGLLDKSTSNATSTAQLSVGP